MAKKRKPGYKAPRKIPRASTGIPTNLNITGKGRGAPTNAFNVGNEVWRQRSKHGRDTLFASPELMAEAAYEYFKWCDEHPLKKAELVKQEEGGYAQQEVNVRRPYIMEGCCLYMGASMQYLKVFKITKGKRLAEFLPVIEAIEQTVRNQQIEGALAGFFNSGLAARINNLAENSNVNHGVQGGDVAVLFPFKRPDNENETKQLK